MDIKSMEEFESEFDIDRTARDLCNHWSRRRRSVDLLATSMYSLGLIYYLIVLFDHFFPIIQKKWPILEKKIEGIHLKDIDSKIFREDAERLKKAMKEKIDELGVSANLENVKELLSNNIYNVIKDKPEWGDIRKDFIEYVVDTELNRVSKIEEELTKGELKK